MRYDDCKKSRDFSTNINLSGFTSEAEFLEQSTFLNFFQGIISWNLVNIKDFVKQRNKSITSIRMFFFI